MRCFAFRLSTQAVVKFENTKLWGKFSEKIKNEEGQRRRITEGFSLTMDCEAYHLVNAGASEALSVLMLLWCSYSHIAVASEPS